MNDQHLSNIELYYSPDGLIKNEIIIEGEYYKHIVNGFIQGYDPCGRLFGK